jgi:hypothetical protein
VHYERTGEDEDRRRLKTMFHTVLDGINASPCSEPEKTLSPALTWHSPPTSMLPQSILEAFFEGT